MEIRTKSMLDRHFWCAKLESPLNLDGTVAIHLSRHASSNVGLPFTLLWRFGCFRPRACRPQPYSRGSETVSWNEASLCDHFHLDGHHDESTEGALFSRSMMTALRAPERPARELQ